MIADIEFLMVLSRAILLIAALSGGAIALVIVTVLVMKLLGGLRD
ncbi:hypothetical protein [Bradyrhizobium sp. SZCCHNS3053]|nr:hypothetical protein [Bradyrhizobium sp. SZCCHNS3053]